MGKIRTLTTLVMAGAGMVTLTGCPFFSFFIRDEAPKVEEVADSGENQDNDENASDERAAGAEGADNDTTAQGANAAESRRERRRSRATAGSALEGFLEPRGDAKESTPLAGNFVLDADEFKAAVTPEGANAAVLALTQDQNTLYAQALGVIARDARLAASGEEVPSDKLAELHGKVAWEVRRKMVEPAAGSSDAVSEKLYLVPRLAEAVSREITGPGARVSTVVRNKGDVLRAEDGSVLAFEVAAETLAKLGYEAPELDLGARVAAPGTPADPFIAGLGKVKASAARATLTPAELSEGIDGRTKLIGESAWLTPEQEQTYGALHTLLGPQEAAFRGELADVKDVHYSVDNEHVYARGLDAEGNKVEKTADLWARSAADPAARRLEELRNAIRVHDDAQHSPEYEARRNASVQALDAKRQEVAAAATQRSDLEQQFYAVTDLRAHADRLAQDDPHRAAALGAVSALEHFTDPNVDPYLGGLMRDHAGASMRVHLYTPQNGARVPFYEIQVYSADGQTLLGTTTRTMGNGLQWGEGINYLIQDINGAQPGGAIQSPADQPEQPQKQKKPKKRRQR